MSIERGEPLPRRLTLDRGWVWPLAIAVGLALVVLVNAVFIYVAVTGADDVAPSYVHGNR
jgi:hypothetical protein